MQKRRMNKIPSCFDNLKVINLFSRIFTFFSKQCFYLVFFRKGWIQIRWTKLWVRRLKFSMKLKHIDRRDFFCCSRWLSKINLRKSNVDLTWFLFPTNVKSNQFLSSLRTLSYIHILPKEKSTKAYSQLGVL